MAALFESLASNHAFIDGNKRTAVVAAIHMLNWNGLDFIASDTEVIDIAIATAEHKCLTDRSITVRPVKNLFGYRMVVVFLADTSTRPGESSVMAASRRA